MQLNRYLASCGIASRRKANVAILEGRVAVNGKTVDTLGRVVDPGTDRITLDGRGIELPAAHRYVLLHKPAGVITSAVDGRRRPTVLDVVGAKERLFPVGRLDLDTVGVLLLTDDGDLAYRLAHPRFEVEKVYEAWVSGTVGRGAMESLALGIVIQEGVTVSGDSRILAVEAERTLVEIRLHEGKKRQVKRMMKAVGHPVLHLKRTVFAGLTVDGLRPGDWRDLTEGEVEGLYRMTGLTRETNG